jgi:hypothetical protein
LDQEDGNPQQHFKDNTILLHTLRKISTSSFKRQNKVPRLKDIWVPMLVTSPNHFPKLYIPSVEDLFQSGDWIFRLEHSGTRSHLLCWKIWHTTTRVLQYQMEFSNEQFFTLTPSAFIPLGLIREGDQFEFLI